MNHFLRTGNYRIKSKAFLFSVLLSVSLLTSSMEVVDNHASSSSQDLHQYYQIDTDSSHIIWKARRIAYGHTGVIKLKQGNLGFDGKQLTSGYFEVDMKTLEDIDLTNLSKKRQLENHLKSKDFFHVVKYPTSSFGITSARQSITDEGNYEITGDLTIKGISQEIRFPAQINLSEGRLTSSAKITIDRTIFNIRYGSGSFFEDLGDKVIYDDIIFEIELVAFQAPPIE